MEVTAKTDKGANITVGKKRYWELGVDIEGDQRLGAWQIKEMIDLSLPPAKTTEERFLQELPPDTKNAEIEVKLTFYPSGPTGKSLEIHRVVKRLNFEK